VKKVWVLVMMVGLAACENSGGTQTAADSLGQSAGTELMKSGDSAKAKGERTLEAIKEKVRQAGDSADTVR
jgi:hypothetical protein